MASQSQVRRARAQDRLPSRTAKQKVKAPTDRSWEKMLLNLHAALDVESFWKAVQRLFTLVPSQLLALALQHEAILPMLTRSTRSMPDGFFKAKPLAAYIAAHPRGKFVRVSDVFPNRKSLMRSDFYRRHLAPQKCLHGVGLFFFKGARLICVITLLRTPKQGDLSAGEMDLLQQLYPQLAIALRSLGSLERERSVRIALEQFLGRLPLPTILLRWNLKPAYQNRAARDFCAVWEKGPGQSRLTKAESPMPPEILDRCRMLKKLWREGKRPDGSCVSLKGEHQVHHPKWAHLRATLQLKQLNSAGVTRPHFLVECEDLHRITPSADEPASSVLPHLVRLTEREQEVAWRVCDGRSNQEIADESRLSVQMVKKHLYSIFHKLEVTSRSRLMALMR